MTRPLSYWKNLYEELKGSAICIDIERTQFNGPIAVVGWAEPRDGLAECNHLVRGASLTWVNLRELFSRYRRAHSRCPGHALTPTGVMAIRCKQFHLPDL